MSQVFLCYSRRDEREAGTIREELRQLGLNVWWDRNLKSRRKWAGEVARALEASDSMIVLVTPDSMASDLVKSEMEQALSDRRFERRVFPVIIQPTYVVPWYFRRLSVFDATKNRTRELTKVAKAIRTVPAQVDKHESAREHKDAVCGKHECGGVPEIV